MAIPKIPSRGGHALPVKPKKKAPKVNSGASYFPTADVTAGDMARLMTQSRQSVASSYKAQPLPALATYQQPFIDAATRESKLGNDMLAAVGGAAQYSQGLTSGLSNWITQNVGGAQQQAQAAAGPSGQSVPAYTSAAATALPTQSYGTSQTQALNALAPYVAGSAQQYQQNITKAQQQALKDYQAAQTTRQSDIASDTQDLYGKNLTALQTSRNNVTKNAIAEYIALTSAGMKADAASEKVRVDTANILKGDRGLDISQQNADTASKNANTSLYKAKHPAAKSAASNKSNVTQAKKDAISSYGKKLGTDSDVTGYRRTVKFAYTAPASSITGSPQTKPVTVTLPATTQDDNDSTLQQQINAWIKNNKSRYPAAKLVSKGTAQAQKTPGVTIHYGPGKGTNWQNALTSYAAHFQPKQGETPQAFRSRMAKQLEAFLPRPKAPKA